MERYHKRIVRTRLGTAWSAAMAKRNRRLTVDHFDTAQYPELTPEDIERLETLQHTWKSGDRFYKLAYSYYGTSEAWWIIALFNGRPTEAHVQIGETIFIPMPVGKVLEMYGF